MLPSCAAAPQTHQSIAAQLTGRTCAAKDGGHGSMTQMLRRVIRPGSAVGTQFMQHEGNRHGTMPSGMSAMHVDCETPTGPALQAQKHAGCRP